MERAYRRHMRSRKTLFNHRIRLSVRRLQGQGLVILRINQNIVQSTFFYSSQILYRLAFMQNKSFLLDTIIASQNQL